MCTAGSPGDPEAAVEGRRRTPPVQGAIRLRSHWLPQAHGPAREADALAGPVRIDPVYRRMTMPEKRTIERARRDKRQGKSPTTQAGEFVREEIHKIRRGEHGARSTKQAIAIGLSEARRAGVKLPPPAKGKTSARTRKSAQRAYEVGQGKRAPRAPSAKRSRAIKAALKREPHNTASRTALSKQASSAAKS